MKSSSKTLLARVKLLRTAWPVGAEISEPPEPAFFRCRVTALAMPLPEARVSLWMSIASSMLKESRFGAGTARGRFRFRRFMGEISVLGGGVGGGFAALPTSPSQTLHGPTHEPFFKTRPRNMRFITSRLVCSVTRSACKMTRQLRHTEVGRLCDLKSSNGKTFKATLRRFSLVMRSRFCQLFAAARHSSRVICFSQRKHFRMQFFWWSVRGL